MEQLPKIVRQRMQASPANEHPDADLLTAFAERGLTKREHGEVAAHLALCAECREVVSLALPETAVIAAPEHRLGKSWARWPVLRWGALAACVVVVGAAIVIGYRPGSKPSQAGTFVTADKQASFPASVPQESKTTQTRADMNEPAAPRTTETREKTLAGARRDEELKSPAQHRGGSADKLAEVPSNRKKESEAFAYSATLAKRNGRQDAAPAANGVPAAPARGAVAGASVARNELARTAPPPAETDRPVDTTVPAPTTGLYASAKTKLAAPAPKKPAAAPFANHGLLETAASAPAAAMPDLKTPRWSLSDDGLPQRSLDAGSTWEKIQVDDKKGFRALSAIGMDVWVGGRGGLIYHSADMGLHWTRIIPVSAEGTLSGDVSRIEFADALHGKVGTTNGETWLTSDAGKTWQRQ